ncbi:MAG: HU family DNA-binding protein [Prevotella sp.]|nr:HU family DNA-binding protein [Prevotella sp.]
MIKLHDFAARLAEKHSISREEAERFLTEMIGVMGEGLSSDKILKIKGLGTFKVVAVNARESVDVNTGERIRIEGREKVSFTPDASMRDLVNRPFAQFETVVLNDGIDFEAENIEENLDDESTEVPTENLTENPTENSVENLNDNSAEESTEILNDNSVEESTEETISQFVDNSSENPSEDLSENYEKNPSENTEEINENNRLEYQKPTIEISMKKQNERERDPYEVFDEGKYYDDELFDEYGYYIGPEDDEKSRLKRFLKNAKVIKWLMGILAAMVTIMCLGMFVLFFEIRRRDATIEKFVEELNSKKTKGETAFAEREAEVREAGAERFYEHERKVDSLKRLMMVVDTGYESAVRVAQQIVDEETKRKEAQLARDEQIRKEKEERRLEKERREDAQRKNVITNKAALARELETYNSDPRVRTGAYVITGIERTVTVQPGQTLAGISKAYLGQGMECYVEAVNGGIKSVQPGQELKIPSVKIKKHHTREPEF